VSIIELPMPMISDMFCFLGEKLTVCFSSSSSPFLIYLFLVLSKGMADLGREENSISSGKN